MKEIGIESEEQAHVLLAAGLQERYGEEFVMAGQAGITNVYESDDPMIYYAEYAPVADRAKTFNANIDIWGGIQDNYGMYIFKEEAESRAAAPLAGFGFIESLAVELIGTDTSRVWREGDSFERYMGDGHGMFDPCVCVAIFLSDEYSDEVQAAQIKECMDSLYDVGFGIEVRFYTENYSDDVLYMRKFAASPDPEFRHNVDYYLDCIKIQKWRMDNERAGAAETASQ